jgi:hypothetical protein
MGILKETAATGVERIGLIQVDEGDVVRLFADLKFEKRLSLIAEGFCPYCEVALGERIPWGGPNFVLAICPCCESGYRLQDTPRHGRGWLMSRPHWCAHTSQCDPDEAERGIRFEFRHFVSFRPNASSLKRRGPRAFFTR